MAAVAVAVAVRHRLVAVCPGRVAVAAVAVAATGIVGRWATTPDRARRTRWRRWRLIASGARIRARVSLADLGTMIADCRKTRGAGRVGEWRRGQRAPGTCCTPTAGRAPEKAASIQSSGWGGESESDVCVRETQGRREPRRGESS